MNPTTQDLFFTRTGMDAARVQSTLNNALDGMDDGELFLEYTQSESLVWDDGRLKNASFNTNQGFGLRAVLGEAAGYAHASTLNEDAIARAASTVRGVNFGQNGHIALHTPSFGAEKQLYTDINPLNEVPFEEKLRILQEIDAYVRSADSRIRQVSVSLSGVWQAVQVMRAGGLSAADIRPLVRLNISVVMEANGRMESGSYGAGGRMGYADYLQAHRWEYMAKEALRQASVNMEAVAAPAGEMPVVIGSGWCGVLLHEAVGHGLEGDFNRKGTSVFSGMMGQRVAAKGVTVIDNGTMGERRGSLSMDDEGTPTQFTTLIEDGILVGYLQDRLNARLMNVAATGNGRRESFSHQPMPRMTNTYMSGGNTPQEEMIKSIKKGLFAVHFGGGQVDITSGKFVFSASEAYLIENGNVTQPVKGATLIGTGADAMQKITMIGNDMCLDPGIGTCGKGGQSVPVGVGQPSLLIGAMTVGGTAVG